MLVGPEQERPRPERRPCPDRPTGAEPCCADCGPLVDDAPGPGQLTVDAFLDRLRGELAAAVDTELADVGLTARDCPYTGLGHLRVHADAAADAVAAGFGARAVTLGPHLAFAAGELDRPGPERDALVAHEIAHSLQQREPDGEVVAGDAALSPAFERDADRSAALVAIRSLLGEDAAAAPSPRLHGGLGLGRCAAAAAPAIIGGTGVGVGLGLTDILSAMGLAALVTLESDTPKVEEEEVSTCETGYPGVPECWALPDEYVFRSPAAALAAMTASRGNPSLVLHSPSPTTSGPCPGQGTHYNVRDGAERAGSITCCPCCSDDPGGPTLVERCRIVW